MADLVSKESEAYYSSLCQFFDITETPTQEDLDSGKLTSFTLKNRTLYVLPPLNESAFLQEKIKFWFEYKIQQQKERESDVQQAVNIERKKKKKDPNRVTYARIIRAKTPLTTPAVVRPALKTPESRQEPKVSIEGLANLVVQVPQIPNSKLTNLRYFLQKALLEEAEEWHVKLVQEYTQKMDAHVVKLSEERAMTIRQQELRMDELEKAWVDHLANLQKMDVAHENEAQVLAHKLKLLKDEYSQAMSGLKDESIKFLTSVIPKYSEKLENAKSSIELSKLAQKFKNSSSAHKETLQKQLFAADKKFEDGRKGLMRSQAPYQHGDAWDILSCRGYHCEIDILALDDHKDSFKDRIETIQLETSESVNRMGAELNLFFDDSVFLDKIDRILKTLKVTLRGKLAVFSQERVTLMDKISSLSQFSKKKGFNWGSIQEMLKVMESIRVDLVHQTLSLNCLKKGITVADFDNCFLLSYDQWLSQKQELRELEDMKIKAHKSKISGVKKISYGPAGGTPRANSAEKLDKAAPLTSLKEGFTASRAGSVKSLHGSNGNLATVKSGDAEVADRNSLAGTTKSRRSEAKEAAYKISKVTAVFYFDIK